MAKPPSPIRETTGLSGAPAFVPDARRVREADQPEVERRDQSRHRAVAELVRRLQAHRPRVQSHDDIPRQNGAQLAEHPFRRKRRPGAFPLRIALGPQSFAVLLQFGEPLAPGPRRLEAGQQRLNGCRHRAAVSDAPDRDREVAGDGLRLEVHLHDPRVPGDVVVGVEGRVEGEAGAERQDDVGCARDLAGHLVAAGADLPEAAAVVVRHRVGVAGSKRDRDIERVRKRGDRSPCLTALGAGPGQDRRRQRRPDQVCDGRDVSRALQAVERDRVDVARLRLGAHLLGEEIARDVEHDRPRRSERAIRKASLTSSGSRSARGTAMVRLVTGASRES